MHHGDEPDFLQRLASCIASRRGTQCATSWILRLIIVLFAALYGQSHAFADADGAVWPTPLVDSDFHPVQEDAIELGRLLFFDPILSGNRNISCATCHHPKFATSDGVALAIGEGGVGLGPDRAPGEPDNLPEQRIGRNAPALFNAGARQFTSFFHDGRLELNESSKFGIRTPMGDDMVAGFNGLLSAQSMFPVLSPDEMAGHYSENEVAQAIRKGDLTGPDGAWALIARRVSEIVPYRERFIELHPDVDTPEDITFPIISNAIADFIASEWRSTDSPFDHFLRGDDEAMTERQTAGAELFYGQAGCSACHAGALQTDHDFHAIAMPQFGPGKAARFESRPIDIGRMRVTGSEFDAHKFRTPSLRNVALTAPYGHNGAYSTLHDVVRHHLDPVGSLNRFERQSVDLLTMHEQQDSDWWLLDHPEEIARLAASNELEPRTLSDGEIDSLVDFLHALTDQDSAAGRLGRPDAVPSGLPVD